MQPISSSSEPTLPLPPRAPSPPNLALSSNNINQDSHRNTSLTRSLPHPRLSGGVPPRGTVYVVERIGRFNRLLYFSRTNSPLLPLVDRVVAAYTTRRVEQSTSSNGIIAAVGNTRVRVHATWTLRVVDPKKLAYRIADVDRCIMMLISVRIRDALSMASEAIINQDVENLRPISDSLRNDIHQTCSKFGVSCLAFRFDSIRNLPQQQQKHQQQQNTAPNSMAQNLYGPQNHLHTPKSLNIADAYHSPADYYTAAAIDSILPELPPDNVTHPVIPASIPSLNNFKPPSSHSHKPARTPYHIPQYPQPVPKRHQRTYWNHELSRNYNYDTMASQSRSPNLPNTEIEREDVGPMMNGSAIERKVPSPNQSLLSPVPPLSKVVLPTAHSPPPKTSPFDANYSPGYSSDNEEEVLPNGPIECPPMSPLPLAGSRKKEDTANSSPTVENKNIYTPFDPDSELNIGEPQREDPAPAPPPTPQGLSVNSATSDSDTAVSEMEEDEKEDKETGKVTDNQLFADRPNEEEAGANVGPVPVEHQIEQKEEEVPKTFDFSTSVVMAPETDDSNRKPKSLGSVLYAPPPSPTGDTEESIDISPELLPMALSRVLVTKDAADADRKAVPLGTPNDQPPATGSGTETIKSPPLASYLDSLPATPRSELPSSENGSDTPTDREEVQALVLHTPGVGQTETSLSSLPSEIPSSSVTGDEPLGDAADVPNAVHVQDRAVENTTQIPGASEEKPNEDSNVQPPNMPIAFPIMLERPLREMDQDKEGPSQLNVDLSREIASPSAKRKEQTVSPREAALSAPRETAKRRAQQPAASILQSVVGKAERVIKNAGASLAPDLFEGSAKLLQSPSSNQRIKGPPLTAKKALRMDMPRTPLPSRTPPPPSLGRPIPSPGTTRLTYGKQPDDRMRRIPSPYEGSTRDSHLPRPRDLGGYRGEEELLEGRLPRRNTPRFVGSMDSASHGRPMSRPGLDDPRLRPSSVGHPRMNPLVPSDFQLTDEDEYTVRKEQKRRDRMVNNINNMEQWRQGSNLKNEDSTDNDSTEMWVDAGSDSEREKFDDDAISQMSQNASRSSRRRHKSKNRRRHESSSRRNKSNKSRKRPEPEDNSDSDIEEEKEEEIDDDTENRSGESSEEEICLECGHHRHHEEIDDSESLRSSSRKSRSKHSSRHSEDGNEKTSSSRSQRRKKSSSERSVDTHKSSSSRDRSSRSKKGSSKDKEKDRRRKSEREESVPRRGKSSSDRKRSQSKSRSSKKRRDDGDNKVQVKSSKSRPKDVSTTYSYNPYCYDAGDVTPIYRHRLPDSDSEQDDPIPWYCEGQSAPDTDFEDEERSNDSDKYMNSVNYTNTSMYSSYGRRDKNGNRRRSAHNRRVRFLYDDLR